MARVHIDRSKCQAYGNCFDEAPELFALDADGYGEVRGDGTVPEGLQEQARSALRSCPARAITMADN